VDKATANGGENKCMNNYVWSTESGGIREYAYRYSCCQKLLMFF